MKSSKQPRDCIRITVTGEPCKHTTYNPNGDCGRHATRSAILTTIAVSNGVATKKCAGCSTILLSSDPDLCVLCDEHGEQPTKCDYPGCDSEATVSISWFDRDSAVRCDHHIEPGAIADINQIEDSHDCDEHATFWKEPRADAGGEEG